MTTNLKTLLSGLLLFGLLLITIKSNATTYFVTVSGDGLMDGSSWGNAAAGTDLQTIIDDAMSMDTIWVECGTYTPTTGMNRSISFAMRTGVAIYGSFLGSEMSLDERDLSCGPCSILSGEIGIPGNSDNSYTVISNAMLDSTAVLDGFTICDGNDDRSPTSNGNGLGGGLYNHGLGSTGFCEPEIRNCLFTNNFASFGAGAFNNGYNNGDSEPTYINCIFYQNHAYAEAGGMDSYGVGGNASPTVINTLFYENTSATNVGAMYAWGGNAGGNSHPVLINCVFANNSANNGYCGAFIANNLDVNGSTSSGSCTVTLQNCIVWNNTATGAGPQFYIRGSGAQVLATYSDIDLTGQSSPHIISGPGTGNIDMTPLFDDIANGDGIDDCWFSNDDGLQLQVTSPCIDGGNNTNTSAPDILGNMRISGTTVDLGAYETQASLPIELISFNAQMIGKKIRLHWKTIQEVDNDFFTIERSRNGHNFESIGRVEGSGHSVDAVEYDFFDTQPYQGVNYYRFQQTDHNEDYSYSKIISVLMTSIIEIYPNPVSDWFYIESENIDKEIHLWNMVGQDVISIDNISRSQNKIKIKIQHLPNGIYFLKTRNTIHKIFKI